jgi:AcrR family transcriptional regulator
VLAAHVTERLEAKDSLRTTTVEVQPRAGVSRGALLHHFGSQAELLAGAVDVIGARRHAETHEHLQSLGDRRLTISEALDSLLASFSSVTYAVEQELWSAARTDADLRALIRPVEQCLGRQMKRGLDRLFDAVPAEVRPSVIRMCVTFVRGLVATDTMRSRPKQVHGDLAAFASLVTAAATDRTVSR